MRWAAVALGLGVSHVLIFVFGNYWAARDARRTVLVVNGEAVSQSELDSVLALYRQEGLRRLSLQKAVDQQAAAMGIMLTGERFKVPDINSYDEPLRRAVIAAHRCDTLFRDVVLHGSTETEKRELYDAFKDELHLYQLTIVFLSTELDIGRLREEMGRGVKLDVLNQRFGSPPPSGFDRQRFTGPVNLLTLKELFPPSETELITQSKLGVVLGPLASQFGPVLVRVDSSTDGYQDLLPQIENIIFEARKVSYHRLLALDSVAQSPLPTKRDEPIGTQGSGQGLLPNKELAPPKRTPAVEIPTLSTPKLHEEIRPGLPKPRSDSVVEPRFLPEPKSKPGLGLPSSSKTPRQTDDAAPN